MHDFQEQCQTVFHVMLCLSIFPSKQFTIKQLLNSCFVIARIINPWLDLGVGQGNHFVSVTVNNNNSPIQVACVQTSPISFVPFPRATKEIGDVCKQANSGQRSPGRSNSTYL